MPGTEELEAVVAALEAMVEDRARLADVPEALRRRLLQAAGRLSRPERAELRTMAKAFRRKARISQREADQRVLDATQIRALRRAAVYPTPAADTQPSELTGGPEEAQLRDPRKCYVCKAEFRTVHFFYDQLCPECAALNWQRRNQHADLSGRVALVTGARVKIGYHAAIKLLRAGCRVIVTTRFPRDAAARYAREADHESWAERLDVYGLDLRHTPSVERFADHLVATRDRLDFVLHNACQTVRRPAGFYTHLLEAESAPATEVSAAERRLLSRYATLADPAPGSAAPLLARRAAVGLEEPARLSQLVLDAEDRLRGGALFPEGALDQDLQQVDLRARNSWRLRHHEVSTVELLEVQLVNAVAPFVMTARLRPLLLRVPGHDKHVVLVSAVEGQFYREWKTDRHPHTNMAKAALNMLTRTSAASWVKDGVHLNSVDTGWVTDEDPLAVAARKVEEHGFSPPLDVVDGAARICDPIFSGLRTGVHVWGKFLKDYRETPW